MSRLPSSPPYDNLSVIETLDTISLEPSQRSQYRSPLIPGPVQPIQEGRSRKRAHDASVLRGESSQIRPTQDFINEVVNQPVAVDVDFNSRRWTSTIDYLIREGSYMKRTTPFWTQIAEIHCPLSQFVKVKKIVGMISELTPNRLGDFLVTIKDPSGTIEGSMHRNIFLDDGARLAIVVGAVVILQNVTVCRFTTNSKYLNIWNGNIVKIIGIQSMIAEYEPTTRDMDGDKNEDVAVSEYEYAIVSDSDVEN